MAKPSQAKSDIGLLSGNMGSIIFLYYYSRFIDSAGIENLAQNQLNLLLTQIDNGFNLPTYCSGIFGVAWGLSLLEEERFIDLSNNDFFKEFDNFYIETHQVYLDNQNFDFLHGYVGLGMYLIKRLENCKSIKSKEFYSQKLLEIILQLRASAIKQGKSYCWSANVVNEKEEYNVDLGLAHGMSSIINFLSRLFVFLAFREEVRPLLNGAISFVRSVSMNYTNQFSLFPKEVTTNPINENPPSRLAWCRGDLGIGLSLWHAGKILRDKSLSSQAVSILLHTSKRRNLNTNLVKDACLCHGSSGLMLIFNYLYKMTTVEEFKEAATFWFEKSMAMSNHPDSETGFLFLKYRNNKWEWKEETDILSGVSGVGLSLLSRLSSKPLKWSQSLMVS
ncbi:lanthionine synthetase LanC family protein [Maribacter sp. 2307UL18-2]|uniref:lanthionine synthetase LanC family protein n=1 Tax=Maribacter sp. 2307UL18-2 TaxID=3386274 RepID=UPI0039BC82A2